MKQVACLLLLASVALAITWRSYDPAGTQVVRVIQVLKAPPTNPYTFEIFASERDLIGTRKQRDAIDFLFSVVGFPHFTVRHYVANTDASERRAARHGLRKIIEYTETGVSGFNPDNDTIVSTYKLWAQVWSALDVTITTPSNGTTIYQVCSHSADKVVEVCTYFA